VILVVGALAACCVEFACLAARSTGRTRFTVLGLSADAAREQPESSLARFGRSRVALALGDPGRLGRRLELAGVTASRDSILGLRAGAVLLAIAMCLVVAGNGAPLALAAAPLLVACAIRVPELVLARMGKRRQERISARVPDLVELLVATTRAGLSPAVAFRRSADVLRGPLADEVSRCVREIDLGVPWTRTLGALVERTDVAPLRRLAVSLGRSQRLGTSVASTLRSVAEDLRADRRARAEEAARRAPVKMLFPLVFLILPAFLLLTVGPVVLATVRSLH
jgi:tight adherence protein C